MDSRLIVTLMTNLMDAKIREATAQGQDYVLCTEVVTRLQNELVQALEPHGLDEFKRSEEPRAKKDSKVDWYRECMKAEQESNKRAEIIAKQILGWKQYKYPSSTQMVYAENQEQVNALGLGESIYKMVDAAIAEMKP